MTKTYLQKPAEVKREWHLVDATDRVLGQIATAAATKLIGKHKPTYTPNVDGGDYVVIINASKVIVTGNKGETKKYYHHSLFPGGLRTRSFNQMQATQPNKIIERAVYNMLPGNHLRKDRMNRLKIYTGAQHEHDSQLDQKEDHNGK
jgi:large subunit ribosomal protein L13